MRACGCCGRPETRNHCGRSACSCARWRHGVPGRLHWPALPARLVCAACGASRRAARVRRLPRRAADERRPQIRCRGQLISLWAVRCSSEWVANEKRSGAETPMPPGATMRLTNWASSDAVTDGVSGEPSLAQSVSHRRSVYNSGCPTGRGGRGPPRRRRSGRCSAAPG